MSNVIRRKYDGIPLKIDGMPIRTDDPNCCCGNPCCTCSTIDLLFSLGLQLQVKITGAITGTCRMGIDEGSDCIVCAGWTLDTSTLFCGLHQTIDTSQYSVEQHV